MIQSWNTVILECKEAASENIKCQEEVREYFLELLGVTDKKKIDFDKWC